MKHLNQNARRKKGKDIEKTCPPKRTTLGLTDTRAAVAQMPADSGGGRTMRSNPNSGSCVGKCVRIELAVRLKTNSLARKYKAAARKPIVRRV
jgi:hypothetical protein